MKIGVAIAGSHGKTTTTSFVAEILAHAGLDPTIVIGGKLRALGSNARLGTGKLLVAEADESDGSFLLLSPTIAVVTNIDAEHLDHFGTVECAEDAFLDFVNRVPFYGRAILCIDHPACARAAAARAQAASSPTARTRDADWVASNVRVEGMNTRFDVRERRRRLRARRAQHARPALRAERARRGDRRAASSACAFADDRAQALAPVRWHPPPLRGARRGSATSSSSTTTGIIPKRCAPRFAPRARASSAVSWSRSSRIATPARATSSTTS